MINSKPKKSLKFAQEKLATRIELAPKMLSKAEAKRQRRRERNLRDSS